MLLFSGFLYTPIFQKNIVLSRLRSKEYDDFPPKSYSYNLFLYYEY